MDAPTVGDKAQHSPRFTLKHAGATAKQPEQRQIEKRVLHYTHQDVCASSGLCLNWLLRLILFFLAPSQKGDAEQQAAKLSAKKQSERFSPHPDYCYIRLFSQLTHQEEGDA